MDVVDPAMLLCFGLCCRKGGRFLELSARMSTEFSKISGLCCGALANNNTKENADNGGLGYEFLEERKGFHEGHLCGVLD